VLERAFENSVLAIESRNAVSSDFEKVAV